MNRIVVTSVLLSLVSAIGLSQNLKLDSSKYRQFQNGALYVLSDGYFTYDGKGRNLEDISYTWLSGTARARDARSTYDYPDEQTTDEIKYRWQNGSWAASGRKFTELTASGKLLKETNTSTGGSSRTVNSYDASDSLVGYTLEIYNSSLKIWEVRTEILFEYDLVKGVKTQVGFNGPKEEGDTSQLGISQLDAKKRLIRLEEYQFQQGKRKLLAITEREYLDGYKHQVNTRKTFSLADGSISGTRLDSFRGPLSKRTSHKSYSRALNTDPWKLDFAQYRSSTLGVGRVDTLDSYFEANGRFGPQQRRIERIGKHGEEIATYNYRYVSTSASWQLNDSTRNYYEPTFTSLAKPVSMSLKVPNPYGGEPISLPVGSALRLYDLQGRLRLYTKSLEQGISVSDLSRGLYIIDVQVGSRLKRAKVLIEP